VKAVEVTSPQIMTRQRPFDLGAIHAKQHHATIPRIAWVSAADRRVISWRIRMRQATTGRI